MPLNLIIQIGVYFVVLLGIWKVLGSIAILVPGFPLIKEWASAGIMIDLTGAAVASLATGGAWWHGYRRARASVRRKFEKGSKQRGFGPF